MFAWYEPLIHELYVLTTKLPPAETAHMCAASEGKHLQPAHRRHTRLASGAQSRE